MHLHRCFTMIEKTPNVSGLYGTSTNIPFFYITVSEPQFKLRASPAVLSLWYFHSKIGWRKLKTCRFSSRNWFWLRLRCLIKCAATLCTSLKECNKFDLTVLLSVSDWLTVPDKMRCNAVCTSLKECNRFDLTVLLECFWLAYHNDLSRWFTISSPPIYLMSQFQFYARGCKSVHNYTWVWKICLQGHMSIIFVGVWILGLRGLVYVLKKVKVPVCRCFFPLVMPVPSYV